jgi:hypothetical protein
MLQKWWQAPDEEVVQELEAQSTLLQNQSILDPRTRDLDGEMTTTSASR